MRVNDLIPWKGSRGGEPAQRGDRDAFGTLQTDLNRTFDFLRMLPFPFGGQSTSLADDSGAFHVDAAESDKEIKVTAELPGMDEKDIDVRASDGVLTISGEKKTEHETKDDDYIVRERSFGRFERTLSLPEGVKAEAAQATFKNGVLTITIPKASQGQSGAKRITVQSH
jgi:HSP20 family protein